MKMLLLALPLVVLGCNRAPTDSTSSPPASQTPGARGEGEREPTPAQAMGARAGMATTGERMDSGDVRTTGTPVAGDAGPAPMDAGTPKPRP